jgi:hypothetical protein
MDENVLRIALAKLNVPQIAIAKALGVCHGTFSRWKRGWYPVPKKYREKIAEALQVEEEALFPKITGNKHRSAS